jgi:hypothetical protein
LGFKPENTSNTREGGLNPIKMTFAIFATPREVKKCVDTIDSQAVAPAPAFCFSLPTFKYLQSTTYLAGLFFNRLQSDYRLFFLSMKMKE